MPDEVIVAMVASRSSAPDAPKGSLLAGLPRTVVQADQLDRVLVHRDHDIDKVLLIEVTDEVLHERVLNRGRSDDTHERAGRGQVFGWSDAVLRAGSDGVLRWGAMSTLARNSAMVRSRPQLCRSRR